MIDQPRSPRGTRDTPHPRAPQPFQIIGSEVVFFTDLPEVTDRVFALYASEAGAAETFANPGNLQPVIEPGEVSL